MHSVNLTAFFSHKFNDTRLNDIIELIKGTCTALDINLVNVNHASPDVPPKEALNLMKNSKLLIALCTREKKFDGDDTYSFSSAVHHEITMAFEKQMSIVIFAEDGVKIDGFLPSMGTFERIEITDNINIETVSKIVKGIHIGKTRSISPHDLEISQGGTSSFYVDYAVMEVRLVELEGNMEWQYIIEKCFCFKEKFDLPLRCGSWPVHEIDGELSMPQANISITDSSVEFVMEVEERELKNAGIDIHLNFTPLPQKDDYLKTREVYRSPFLVPLIKNNDDNAVLRVNDIDYHATDGFCLITHNNKVTIKVILPSWYPINYEQITPVVATFSSGLDYVVNREIERIERECLFEKKSFNDELTMILEIENPFYQHYYGIAWNPPDENIYLEAFENRKNK